VRTTARLRDLQGELSRERERTRRLEAQLRNLADHDPVTDLRNRPSLLHGIEGHLAGCTRYGPEGALLLVGLDGLAALTEAEGAQEADRTLAEVAEVVAGRLRDTDLVGRWGTDELAILLPRASEAEAEVVATSLVHLVGLAGARRARAAPPSGKDRVRAAPEGSRPEAAGAPLSASIGVAWVTAEVVDPGQLVDRARRAMVVVRGRPGGGWQVAALEEPT